MKRKIVTILKEYIFCVGKKWFKRIHNKAEYIRKVIVKNKMVWKSVFFFAEKMVQSQSINFIWRVQIENQSIFYQQFFKHYIEYQYVSKQIKCNALYESQSDLHCCPWRLITHHFSLNSDSFAKPYKSYAWIWILANRFVYKIFP